MQRSLYILIISILSTHSTFSQSIDSIPYMYIFASIAGHTVGFPAIGVDMPLNTTTRAAQMRIKFILSANPLLQIVNSAIVPSVVFGRAYCLEFGAGFVYDLYSNVPERYSRYPKSRLKATILIGYRYQNSRKFFAVGYTPIFGLPGTADERNFMFGISYGITIIQ